MKKDKLDKAILEEYQWWNHTSLLNLMQLWVDNASVRHANDSSSANRLKTAKTLETVSQLITRINNDAYLMNLNKVFDNKNNRFDSVLYKELLDKENEREVVVSKTAKEMRRQDVEMLFKIMSKHILNWWD